MTFLYPHDTKTEAQKQQHTLFHHLGTLARAKSNISGFARPRDWTDRDAAILVPLTPLEQRILDAATYVLADLMNRAQEKMQQLPSKKNLAKQQKQNNQP